MCVCICVVHTHILTFLLHVCLVLQQARAEQEEEFISNTLFKKIQALQKEKETLAVNYEKEEEFLTNELSRKLMQVRLWHKGIRSASETRTARAN